MQTVFVSCFERDMQVNTKMCFLNDWEEIEVTMSSCKKNVSNHKAQNL